MDEQAEQVALVTGAATGVGGAVAMELARRGWSIFMQHFVSPEAAADAAADVEAAAGDANHKIGLASARADLSRAGDREQLVEQVLEEFGRIDLLVNAAPAAPQTPGDLLEMTEEGFRDVMDAALTGTVFLTRQVASEMVRLVEAAMVENPKIVTINSIGAYTTSMDHGPHCMARAALAMMTRLFADRLGELGINVYEIRVGILSGQAADTAHARYDRLIQQGLTPIRRWCRPGDVARAVVAIAENLLGFSTGEVINVDGGFHLRRL